MEELKRFQGSTFDTIARRKLVEDRDTILELTGKIQELQNEINCMNDSRDFQDAVSVRSGQSHVANQPVFFPRHPDPGGMLSRSLGMLSATMGRHVFGTHMVHRETFLQIQRRLLQHLIRKCRILGVFIDQYTPSPHVMSESQTPVQNLRCQSGPSARNSVILGEGGFSKNFGADQQRPQISDLHFDKYASNVRLLEEKIQD